MRISANGRSVDQILNWNGIGWVTMMVKRTGENIVTWENGTLRGTQNDTLGYFTDAPSIMINEAGEFFTGYVFLSAISDNAYDYWYRDLTENNGNVFLPDW